MLATLQQLDNQILLFINNNLSSKILDWFFYTISDREFFSIPLLLATYTYIWLSKQPHAKATIAFSFIVVIVNIFLSESAKIYFLHSRPCATDIVSMIYYMGELRNPCNSQYGFPSSHSWIFFVFCYFHFRVLELRSWLTNIKTVHHLIAYGLMIIAILVSLSRIYLGAHFPYQVVVGASAGIFFGELSFQLYQLYLKHSKQSQSTIP